MRKLPLILALALAALLLAPSCGSDNNNQQTLLDAYGEWLQKNEDFVKEQQARTNPDGSPYFEVVVPPWDPSAFVLIHYFNDRELTKGNLSPMLTSTIDTRYYVTYYNGSPIDSSYNQTAYGPGIFRTQLKNVINGWVIAYQHMRVGDTAQVIIPYNQGYGTNTSSGVAPFSTLVYNMSLVDIPYYEVNPKD